MNLEIINTLHTLIALIFTQLSHHFFLLFTYLFSSFCLFVAKTVLQKHVAVAAKSVLVLQRMTIGLGVDIGARRCIVVASVVPLDDALRFAARHIEPSTGGRLCRYVRMLEPLVAKQLRKFDRFRPDRRAALHLVPAPHAEQMLERQAGSWEDLAARQPRKQIRALDFAVAPAVEQMAIVKRHDFNWQYVGNDRRRMTCDPNVSTGVSSSRSVDQRCSVAMFSPMFGSKSTSPNCAFEAAWNGVMHFCHQRRKMVRRHEARDVSARRGPHVTGNV